MTLSKEQHRRVLRRLVICATLLGALTALAVLKSGTMDDLDRLFGREPQDLTEDSAGAARFWLWIGQMSAPNMVVVAALAVAVVLLLRRHPKWAVLTAVSVPAAYYLTRGLKHLVERQRPRWNEPVEVLASYSFPSAHSSVIAAIACAAIAVSAAHLRQARYRRAVIATAIAITLLVGADRVFLGVHNVSDVIAGYLLGSLVVLTTMLVLHHRPVAHRGRA